MDIRERENYHKTLRLRFEPQEEWVPFLLIWKKDSVKSRFDDRFGLLNFT